MPKAGWWIVAGMLTVELVIIGTHRTEAKAFMRAGYVWLWEHAPKPEGTPIPDRFL